MKKISVFFVIIGLVFILPNITFGSDENSMKNSSEGGSGNSSEASGESFGKSLAIAIVVSAVVLGSLSWGGITTTRKSRRSKKARAKKVVAIALFSEATKGYGVKVNIDDLAEYFFCSSEEIIETISKMSINNTIDVYNSLIDEKTAEASLEMLEGELFKMAFPRDEFRAKLAMSYTGFF